MMQGMQPGMQPSIMQGMQPNMPPPNIEQDDSNTTTYIVVGVVLLVLAMIVLYFIFSGDSKDSKKSSTNNTCPTCPTCPTGETQWRRYNNINAVWGLGGVPKDETGTEFTNPPASGVKLYGRFDNADQCEQACKDDQPFCNSWALHPDTPGIFRKTCYGIDNSHIIGYNQGDMISGRRFNILP